MNRTGNREANLNDYMKKTMNKQITLVKFCPDKNSGKIQLNNCEHKKREKAIQMRIILNYTRRLYAILNKNLKS